MRKAPNLKRTVRGILTINGGSHPLLVSYVFCASASYSSWWSIIDHLLYQQKEIKNVLLRITTYPHVLLLTLDLNKLGLPKIQNNYT